MTTVTAHGHGMYLPVLMKYFQFALKYCFSSETIMRFSSPYKCNGVIHQLAFGTQQWLNGGSREVSNRSIVFLSPQPYFYRAAHIITHETMIPSMTSFDLYRSRSNPGGGRDFPHPSRPVLRPNQPAIQCVPGPSRG